MTLFHKIFSVQFLTSLVLLFSVFITIQISTARHFEEIENIIEKDMVTTISDSLCIDFERHGNWNHFRRNPQSFEHLMETLIAKKEFFKSMPPPKAPEPRNDNGPFPAPIKPGPSAMPERERSTPRFGPPHRRLTLFDQNQVKIAGAFVRPEDKDFLKISPILCDGKPVGYIGFRKMDRYSDAFRFSFKNRLNDLYMVGIILFILTGLASFYLSRLILSPVGKLTKGTHALTRFNFATRINVKTNDELGRLADDFNRMAATLERYETMRKQWVVDISHELRTPLSILKGELEALQDGIRPFDRAHVDSLHSEVVYLETLVNDLHLLSAADTHALSVIMEPLKPVVVLRSVIDTFAMRLEQAQLSLNIRLKENQCTVNADWARLKQVFSNIFENNFQYTGKPGTISVWDKIQDHTLIIGVQDTGPGVPPESLEKIFDRLYRVDPSRKRSLKGSGLGLSICKAIINAHDGDISATLTKEGGLLITIHLPLIEP